MCHSRGRLQRAHVHVRSPIRLPGSVPRPRIRTRGRHRAGARHRRQHRDFQHRQCRAAAAAAFRGTGSARPVVPRAAAERVSRDAARFRSRRRTSTTGSATRSCSSGWRLPVSPVHPDRRRHGAEAVVAGAVGADFFEVLARPAGARPRVPARGGLARALARRRCSATDSGRATRRGSRTSIGRTLPLNGEAFTIVGVMPPHVFESRRGAITARDLWVPLALHRRRRAPSATITTNRSIARLKPGVDVGAGAGRR